MEFTREIASSAEWSNLESLLGTVLVGSLPPLPSLEIDQCLVLASDMQKELRTYLHTTPLDDLSLEPFQGHRLGQEIVTASSQGDYSI